MNEILGHIWQVHAQNTGPGPCSICNSDVKSVRDHIKTKHLGIKDKKARCFHCHKRVPNLDKHLQNQKRNFKCTICHIAVSKKSCLKRHLSVFHKCQICPEILKNKTFSNPYCSPCKKKYVPSVKVAKVSGEDYLSPVKLVKNDEKTQLGSEPVQIEEKYESKVLPDLCEKDECLAPLASPFPPALTRRTPKIQKQVKSVKNKGTSAKKVPKDKPRKRPRKSVSLVDQEDGLSGENLQNLIQNTENSENLLTNEVETTTMIHPSAATPSLYGPNGGRRYLTKGQLILKCPFGVFKSSKKQTIFFQDFFPSL